MNVACICLMIDLSSIFYSTIIYIRVTLCRTAEICCISYFVLLEKPLTFHGTARNCSPRFPAAHLGPLCTHWWEEFWELNCISPLYTHKWIRNYKCGHDECMHVFLHSLVWAKCTYLNVLTLLCCCTPSASWVDKILFFIHHYLDLSNQTWSKE